MWVRRTTSTTFTFRLVHLTKKKKSNNISRAREIHMFRFKISIEWQQSAVCIVTIFEQFILLRKKEREKEKKKENVLYECSK